MSEVLNEEPVVKAIYLNNGLQFINTLFTETKDAHSAKSHTHFFFNAYRLPHENSPFIELFLRSEDPEDEEFILEKTLGIIPFTSVAFIEMAESDEIPQVKRRFHYLIEGNDEE